MSVHTIRKYWRLFWKFRALQLMALLEYRGNFWFWSCVSGMWTIFNFFFFGLLVGAKGTLGGWTPTEMYILLSTFTIIDAFTWSFFYHNMQKYVKSIFSGELSMILTKPIDTQYLLSIQENSYNNIVRFSIGCIMLFTSVQRAQIVPTLPQIALYLLFLCLTLLFIYSLWFMIATFSFWVERLENINEIIPAARSSWQVPRQIYTGILSTFFTVIVPFGLMITLPSEILLGRAAVGWLVYFAVFTALLFLAARIFFLFSLRQYSAVGN